MVLGVQVLYILELRAFRTLSTLILMVRLGRSHRFAAGRGRISRGNICFEGVALDNVLDHLQLLVLLRRRPSQQGRRMSVAASSGRQGSFLAAGSLA